MKFIVHNLRTVSYTHLLGHSAPLPACPARIAIGACPDSEWHDIEPYGGTPGRDGGAEVVWSRT